MIAALLLAVLAGDPVSVAVESDRAEWYLGERIPVRIRIEAAGKFLRDEAVPLTARKMDLPLRVEAAWMKGLGGASGGATLSVNDDVVSATRTDGADGAAVIVIERILAPEKAGDLELAGPVVRFARATRWDEDALGTRVPVERTEGAVTGAPLRLRILPLPAEGRPAGFAGPVGRFTIEAKCDAKEATVGRPIHLLLSIGGTGDFAAVKAPRLDGLAGFHVAGWLDVGDGARVFSYELVPLSAEVKEIPSIAFDYFDPGPPAGYRVVRTAAIPIRVAPGAEAPKPPPAEEGSSTTLLVGIAIAVAIGAALFFARRRR